MQNVSSCDLCHLDLVPSVNMTYSQFQICLLNWSSMLWITLPFTVNLPDVVPLREPPCHSEICSIIVSCSKSLCFQKVAALFALAEDLPHKVLQLVSEPNGSQRSNCHENLGRVSRDMLEVSGLPKPQIFPQLLQNITLPLTCSVYTSLRRVDVSDFSSSFSLPVSSSDKVLEGLKEVASLCLGDVCSY